MDLWAIKYLGDRAVVWTYLSDSVSVTFLRYFSKKTAVTVLILLPVR